MTHSFSFILSHDSTFLWYLTSSSLKLEELCDLPIHRVTVKNKYVTMRNLYTKKLDKCKLFVIHLACNE